MANMLSRLTVNNIALIMRPLASCQSKTKKALCIVLAKVIAIFLPYPWSRKKEDYTILFLEESFRGRYKDVVMFKIRALSVYLTLINVYKT